MVKAISLRSYIFATKKKKNKKQKIPQLGDTSKQVNFGHVPLHARGTTQLCTVSSLSESGTEVSLPSSRFISLQWWQPQSPQALTMESFFPHLHVQNFWSSLLPEPHVPGTQVLNVHSAEYSQHLHNLPEAGTFSLGPQHVLQPPFLCTCCGLWGLPPKQDYPFVFAFVLLEQADFRSVPYRFWSPCPWWPVRTHRVFSCVFLGPGPHYLSFARSQA